MASAPHIEVRKLTMGYGERIVQQDLDFTINRGDVFVIMGGSGCGKSTLLKQMIGLSRPMAGSILYDGQDYWAASEQQQATLRRGFGVLFQAGALWSSLTLDENVGLPLREFTTLPAPLIKEIVSLKLALVGLAGYEAFYPSELSGGMKKRAGLARAMALDPAILFFDEPSAGLDPISSRRLDELILELRNGLGATVVLVTHELPSIFAIANNSVFLDAGTRTMIATGDPKVLVEEGPAQVRQFLKRGEP